MPIYERALGVTCALALQTIIKGNYCSMFETCPLGYFCNFENIYDGSCESCFDTCPLNECSSDCGLNYAGVDSCLNSCQSFQQDLPICHGYITNVDSFDLNRQPRPINCGDSPYGHNWGPPQYQRMSCCSAEGLYFASTGQLGKFNTNIFQSATEECMTYVEALLSAPCDPLQGVYTTPQSLFSEKEGNFTFKICKSSCDKMFAACGPSDLNSPNWARYEDGKSLCEKILSSELLESYSFCNINKGGYLCSAGIDFEVTDDEKLDKCFSIVIPSNETQYYACLEQSEHNNHLCLGGKDCESSEFCNFTQQRCQPCSEDCIQSGCMECGLVEEDDINECKESCLAIHDAGVVVGILMAFFLMFCGTCCCCVCICLWCSSLRQPNPAVVPKRDPPPQQPSHNPQSNIGNNRSRRDVDTHGSLLSYIRSSNNEGDNNIREIIRRWMVDNPRKTASLSPQEVADILGHMSFSLEQKQAAAEMAQGMKGNLTCAHIVAAIQQCDYAGAEIAMEMVPFVIDPENKTNVVNQFTLSFQKEEIFQRFSSSKK